jgi:hypothetical protein
MADQKQLEIIREFPLVKRCTNITLVHLFLHQEEH